MSYTVQYLQSELAAQGLEVSVLVNCLVQDAIRLGASDLHIEPWETAIAVRARVNGVLTEVAHLPLDLMEKVSMRFKVMSNLVTYQTGMPQDGTPSAARRWVACNCASPSFPPRAARRSSSGCSTPGTGAST